MKAIYPMVTDKNNRFAQSEDFSLTWNAVSSSVTVNQITAPNGISTADLIREEAGTGDHYVYQTVDTLVSGNEYVLSVYGRFLNRPWIALQTNDGAQAWFNLQTGVTGSFTGSSVSITNVGSGWYRCALFYTASSAGAKNQHIHLSDVDGNYNYTGVATTGSYLWGAQFENGNLLGPYRATTTTGFTTGSMFDQVKFNLKNPTDSDAAFRLTYSGSWNPGYSGVRGDGSTAYADTKLNVSSSLSGANSHLSLYQNSLSSKTSEQGIGSYDTFYMSFYPASADNQLSSIGQPSLSTTSPGLGFFQINALNTTQKLFKNGTTLGSNTLTSTTLSNSSVIIGASRFASFGNNPIWFDSKQIVTTTIGDGLTDYQAKALYWIVQKFQTTLGRQVY
jgi:hypothetical protein